MEKCILSTAGIDDVSMMLELWESLPGMGLGPGDDKAAIIGFIRRNPHTCLVLKSKGQIIGTVLEGLMAEGDMFIIWPSERTASIMVMALCCWKMLFRH